MKITEERIISCLQNNSITTLIELATCLDVTRRGLYKWLKTNNHDLEWLRCYGMSGSRSLTKREVSKAVNNAPYPTTLRELADKLGVSTRALYAWRKKNLIWIEQEQNRYGKMVDVEKNHEYKAILETLKNNGTNSDRLPKYIITNAQADSDSL